VGCLEFFCEVRVYLRRNSGLTPNVRSTSHPNKNTIQSRIKIGVPTTAGTLCKNPAIAPTGLTSVAIASENTSHKMALSQSKATAVIT
jgi:hypothetical protein